MPAFVVVDIDIHDPVRYERYKELAPPSIFRYGGRYAVRGAAVTALEGTWKPGRFVILEFPTADQARAWWNSPEYASAKALRQSCAATNLIIAEGPSLEPPA